MIHTLQRYNWRLRGIRCSTCGHYCLRVNLYTHTLSVTLLHSYNHIREPLDIAAVLFLPLFSHPNPHAFFLLWPLSFLYKCSMHKLVLSPCCFRPDQCFHAMTYLPSVPLNPTNSSPTQSGKPLNLVASSFGHHPALQLELVSQTVQWSWSRPWKQ